MRRGAPVGPASARTEWRSRRSSASGSRRRRRSSTASLSAVATSRRRGPVISTPSTTVRPRSSCSCSTTASPMPVWSTAMRSGAVAGGEVGDDRPLLAEGNALAHHEFAQPENVAHALQHGGDPEVAPPRHVHAHGGGAARVGGGVAGGAVLAGADRLPAEPGAGAGGGDAVELLARMGAVLGPEVGFPGGLGLRRPGPVLRFDDTAEEALGERLLERDAMQRAGPRALAQIAAEGGEGVGLAVVAADDVRPPAPDAEGQAPPSAPGLGRRRRPPRRRWRGRRAGPWSGRRGAPTSLRGFRDPRRRQCGRRRRSVRRPRSGSRPWFRLRFAACAPSRRNPR